MSKRSGSSSTRAGAPLSNPRDDSPPFRVSAPPRGSSSPPRLRAVAAALRDFRVRGHRSLHCRRHFVEANPRPFSSPPPARSNSATERVMPSPLKRTSRTEPHLRGTVICGPHTGKARRCVIAAAAGHDEQRRHNPQSNHRNGVSARPETRTARLTQHSNACTSRPPRAVRRGESDQLVVCHRRAP